jgi:hypothetical protein
MNYIFCFLPDLISTTMHQKANNKIDEDWDKIYPIYYDLPQDHQSDDQI